MPAVPIAGISPVSPTANDLAQAVGFSRSQSLQAGPGVLGTPAGADVRETSFGTIFANAVENMENRSRHAKKLGVSAVTGRLEDIHNYTIAAAESKLTIELTSTIRNKAVEAFNEIMRMQA